MALEVGLLLRDRITVNKDESIEIPSSIWSGSIVSYSGGILIVELKGAATRPIQVEAGDTIELRSLPLERIISKSDGMVLTVILVPLTKYEIPYIALRKSYVAAKVLDPTGAYITPAKDDTLLSVKSFITPILKGSLFNTAISANTNMFASSLTPTYSPSLFRIYVCFNAAGVLSLMRTKDTTTVAEQFNAGNDLTANAAYLFDVLVEGGESINLQYSVAATALCVKVYEVGAEVS
jgi:hypothetical protein